MNEPDIIQTLIYVRDHLLASEEQFTRGNHFLDADGMPLPVTPHSAARAARCDIEGAIVKALWELRLIPWRANHTCPECRAVMCALADTRGAKGGEFAKIRSVQRLCNRNGFLPTRNLVVYTIRRLSN